MFIINQPMFIIILIIIIDYMKLKGDVDWMMMTIIILIITIATFILIFFVAKPFATSVTSGVQSFFCNFPLFKC